MVAALLDAYPEGTSEKDSSGSLALHLAAEYGASAAVVAALLDAHPEGAGVEDVYDRLPLHYAYEGASGEVVLLLRSARS